MSSAVDPLMILTLTDNNISEKEGKTTKKAAFLEGVNEVSIYRLIGSHPNVLGPVEAQAISDNNELSVNITTPTKLRLTPEVVKQFGVSKWLADMLRVLLHLDRCNISHNDIKLDNMLYDSDSGNFLLFDFGIATYGEDNMQLRSATPVTMPPEVIARNVVKTYLADNRTIELDSRADLYSLGLTLFYVLTGEQPLEQGLSGLQAYITRVNAPVAEGEDVTSHYTGLFGSEELTPIFYLQHARPWLYEIDPNSLVTVDYGNWFDVINRMTEPMPESRPTIAELAAEFGVDGVDSNVVVHKLRPAIYQLDEQTDRQINSVLSIFSLDIESLDRQVTNPREVDWQTGEGIVDSRPRLLAQVSKIVAVMLDKQTSANQSADQHSAITKFSLTFMATVIVICLNYYPYTSTSAQHLLSLIVFWADHDYLHSSDTVASLYGLNDEQFKSALGIRSTFYQHFTNTSLTQPLLQDAVNIVNSLDFYLW